MATVPYKAVATAVLQFGITAIPVKVIKATESVDKETAVHNIHAGDCKGAVGRKDYCKVCDAILAADQIGKAVGGVPFDDAILDQFKVESDKAIRIDAFVPLNSIDLRLFSEPRYIVPDKSAHAALRAFADTMLDRADAGSPVAAVGKVAERETEKVIAIYAIAPKAGEAAVLVAGVLRRPETVRDATALAAEMGTGQVPTAQIKGMVNALIDAMTEPVFNATKYTDEKKALRDKALREIAAGQKPTANALAEPKATAPMDLMAALTASVAAVQKPGTKVGKPAKSKKS